MISPLTKISFAALLATLVGLVGTSQAVNQDREPPGSQPALINTCLITNDVAQLVEFYRQVLRIQPKIIGSEYAEFPTGVGVLAIFSAGAQEKYIPHSAEPAKNKTAILEFRVPDVDKEYARLQGIVKTWVKPPTTQPWGTRSTYFRDPDGNLVDFFAVAKN